jgi:hypothetical protein
MINMLEIPLWDFMSFLRHIDFSVVYSEKQVNTMEKSNKQAEREPLEISNDTRLTRKCVYNNVETSLL